jgi:hypothetical protein
MPIGPNSVRAFISYADAVHETAERLGHDLREHGMECRIDRPEHDAVQSIRFPAKHDEATRADIFICLVNPDLIDVGQGVTGIARKTSRAFAFIWAERAWRKVQHADTFTIPPVIDLSGSYSNALAEILSTVREWYPSDSSHQKLAAAFQNKNWTELPEGAVSPLKGPRTLLVHGAPGTGKTAFATMLAVAAFRRNLVSRMLFLSADQASQDIDVLLKEEIKEFAPRGVRSSVWRAFHRNRVSRMVIVIDGSEFLARDLAHRVRTILWRIHALRVSVDVIITSSDYDAALSLVPHEMVFTDPPYVFDLASEHMPPFAVRVPRLVASLLPNASVTRPAEPLSTVQAKSGSQQSEISNGSLWATVRGSTASDADRAEALANLAAMGENGVADFIADQLTRADRSDTWRDALVFASEDVRFEGDSQQQRVADALLEIAESIRENDQARTEPVLWACLRRFSSLGSPAQACRLAPFLDHPSVHSKIAVLAAIQNLFANGPAADLNTTQTLADRVVSLAQKFLDPDLLTPGDNAAVATSAVSAAACLGDPRFEDLMTQFPRTGREWAKDVLADLLGSLVTKWKKADGGSTASATSMNRVTHAIDILANERIATA